MVIKKSELHEKREKYGLIERVFCDEDETKKFIEMKKAGTQLPSDVLVCVENPNCFFRYKDTDLTKEETDELFRFYQLDYLKAIKNGVAFFVVLTVISLILALRSALT